MIMRYKLQLFCLNFFSEQIISEQSKGSAGGIQMNNVAGRPIAIKLSFQIIEYTLCSDKLVFEVSFRRAVLESVAYHTRINEVNIHPVSNAKLTILLRPSSNAAEWRRKRRY